MGGPSLETPVPEKASEKRLDSWKEIAGYLNRDVTTVQRWEKREGMPVHRHLHDKRGSVYALRTELDAWVLGRKAGTGEANGTPHLDRVSVDGRSIGTLVRGYSTDPAWSADGTFVIYSAPDVGTRFALKAANVDGTEHALPALSLTLGSRRIAGLSGEASSIWEAILSTRIS